jgi:hypothetical protein
MKGGMMTGSKISQSCGGSICRKMSWQPVPEAAPAETSYRYVQYSTLATILRRPFCGRDRVGTQKCSECERTQVAVEGGSHASHEQQRVQLKRSWQLGFPAQIRISTRCFTERCTDPPNRGTVRDTRHSPSPVSLDAL